LEGERILDFNAEIVAYFTPYQLKDFIAIKSLSTLIERIKERGDILDIVDVLSEPTDKVLDVFIRQPCEDDLHIIVEIPATGELRLTL